MTRAAYAQGLTAGGTYHSRNPATTNVDPVTTTTSSIAAIRRATVSASTGSAIARPHPPSDSASVASRCGRIARAAARCERRERERRGDRSENLDDSPRILALADRDHVVNPPIRETTRAARRRETAGLLRVVSDVEDHGRARPRRAPSGRESRRREARAAISSGRGRSPSAELLEHGYCRGRVRALKRARDGQAEPVRARAA